MLGLTFGPWIIPSQWLEKPITNYVQNSFGLRFQSSHIRISLVPHPQLRIQGLDVREDKPSQNEGVRASELCVSFPIWKFLFSPEMRIGLLNPQVNGAFFARIKAKRVSERDPTPTVSGKRAMAASVVPDWQQIRDTVAKKWKSHLDATVVVVSMTKSIHQRNSQRTAGSSGVVTFQARLQQSTKAPRSYSAKGFLDLTDTYLFYAPVVYKRMGNRLRFDFEVQGTQDLVEVTSLSSDDSDFTFNASGRWEPKGLKPFRGQFHLDRLSLNRPFHWFAEGSRGPSELENQKVFTSGFIHGAARVSHEGDGIALEWNVDLDSKNLNLKHLRGTYAKMMIDQFNLKSNGMCALAHGQCLVHIPRMEMETERFAIETHVKADFGKQTQRIDVSVRSGRFDLDYFLNGEKLRSHLKTLGRLEVNADRGSWMISKDPIFVELTGVASRLKSSMSDLVVQNSRVAREINLRADLKGSNDKNALFRHLSLELSLRPDVLLVDRLEVGVNEGKGRLSGRLSLKPERSDYNYTLFGENIRLGPLGFPDETDLLHAKLDWMGRLSSESSSKLTSHGELRVEDKTYRYELGRRGPQRELVVKYNRLNP